MSNSIFIDKSKPPSAIDLKEALGKKHTLWQSLRAYTFKLEPKANEEWKYPGKNYGWNYRIRDAKRVLVYFVPCDAYFKISLVFGAKATKAALQSSISPEIKNIIESAKVYVEGRGFALDVTDDTILNDIKTLIEIKIKS